MHRGAAETRRSSGGCGSRRTGEKEARDLKATELGGDDLAVGKVEASLKGHFRVLIVLLLPG